MNQYLSTYCVDGVEVNYIFERDPNADIFLMLTKLIWINNLPDHYTLLNEGEEMIEETTRFLAGENHTIPFSSNLHEKYWKIGYSPVVNINTEMEFLE